MEGLALLFQKSHYREGYPGTVVRLLPGQNPNRELGRQCGVLSDASVCLQYRSLVQAALLTPRLSLFHARHNPDRFLSLARQAHEEGESEHLGPPTRLSLQGAVYDRAQENRRTSPPSIFLILHLYRSRRSFVYAGSRHNDVPFTHN